MLYNVDGIQPKTSITTLQVYSKKLCIIVQKIIRCEHLFVNFTFDKNYNFCFKED